MGKKTPNRIKSESLQRDFRLVFDAVEDESRTVPAAISSELSVKRWFGNETLLHTEKAINMERADNGLPLLYNHDHSKPIGRADNVQLVDGVLRADLTFSENTLASEVFKDVKDEFLRDVSLGYQIERYKDVKGGVEATRWNPLEVSIVTVPADHTVGINRNHETIEENMENENENGNKTIVQEVGAQHTLGVAAGMKQEQDRANGIRSMFSAHMNITKAPELMERCLSDFSVSVEAARAELLDLFSVGFEPTAKATETKTEVGMESGDKLARAIEDTLSVRVGVETDEKIIAEVNSGGLRGHDIVSMARDFVTSQGRSVKGLDNMGILGSAFERIGGGHSTSDFPSIMANVANKSMSKGYNEAPTTWRQWASVGSVSDFKRIAGSHNLEIKILVKMAFQVFCPHL